MPRANILRTYSISVLAKLTKSVTCVKDITGADPGFQVRGGALKENAPSGGRREICWGISCEKSRFYAKKSYKTPAFLVSVT
jgi:hypothetical protein